MSWSGSGTFSRLYNWVARRDAGSPTNKIGATEMDAEFDNFAVGLENCVTLTGETVPVADLPMGGFKHSNVAAASSRSNYSRVAESQDGIYWKAASPGGTIDAMTGTLAPAPSAYTEGMLVGIVVPGTGSNTVTTPTINLNSLGVKTIRKFNGALVAGDYSVGDTLWLRYDGTYFQLLNPGRIPSIPNNTITSAMIVDGTITGADIAASTVNVSNLATGVSITPWVAAAGTDTITGTYSPAIAAYTDGLILMFRAAGANTSTTPTFNANSVGAKTIVKAGNVALVAGDIPAQHYECVLKYNSTLDKFELLNPKIGAADGNTVFNNGGSFETALPRNAQTGTSYTVLTGDRGKHLTLSNASAIAVTLPQAGSAGFGSSWWCIVESIGAGTSTITPTTSTINGGTTLILDQGASYLITSDGTNYRALNLGSPPLTTGVGINFNVAEPGFRGVPQNSKAAAYTFVMSDAGKHIFHDEVTARTFTIDSNANVAWPIGTAITIVNNNGAGSITLAITSDTLRRGDGTAGTGSRTIAADSIATIIKTKSTEWMITGKFS